MDKKKRKYYCELRLLDNPFYKIVQRDELSQLIYVDLASELNVDEAKQNTPYEIKVTTLVFESEGETRRCECGENTIFIYRFKTVRNK